MPKKIKVKSKKPERLKDINIALQLYRSGNFQEAELVCRQILQINPNHAEAWHLLGLILLQSGQFDTAADYISKAIEVNPDEYLYYYNLGNVFALRGHLNEAINNFKKSLELKPVYVEAYNNLGNALKEKGLIDEAMENYKKALILKPDFAEAHNNLGLIFENKGWADDAIKEFKKSLESKPDYVEAYYNLSNAFADKGLVDEAIENFNKTLELAPDFVKAFNNLGVALADKGMIEEAIEKYNKALMLKTDFAEAHWNMSLISLKTCDFEKGWKKYEWRLLKEDQSTRSFPQPHWDGSPLEGRTLLLHAEQGVGDEIMFSSCLPEVISRGGNCMLECDKRLMPLFSRSFPEARLIPRLSVDDPEQTFLQEADVKIAIGSLPLYFRPDLASFPRQKSFLVPDEQKVEKWRARFNKLGEGLKVGISWQGGKKEKVRRIRSISLKKWAELFSLEGVYFINLQYGDCAKELQDIKEKQGITVHDWEDADPLKDLDNFAAQIAALDLVISVDNSTVHMAGALGVPVWAMLPFASDWRWMQDFEDTPWYESVRLYRQSTTGEWDGVLERVSLNLRQYVTTGVMPGINEKYSYKEAG